MRPGRAKSPIGSFCLVSTLTHTPKLRALHADACTLMGQLARDASQRRERTTANTYYEQSAGSHARARRDVTLEAHALLRT